jgi:hypothetical protein
MFKELDTARNHTAYNTGSRNPDRAPPASGLNRQRNTAAIATTQASKSIYLMCPDNQATERMHPAPGKTGIPKNNRPAPTRTGRHQAPSAQQHNSADGELLEQRAIGNLAFAARLDCRSDSPAYVSYIFSLCRTWLAISTCNPE